MKSISSASTITKRVQGSLFIEYSMRRFRSPNFHPRDNKGTNTFFIKTKPLPTNEKQENIHKPSSNLQLQNSKQIHSNKDAPQTTTTEASPIRYHPVDQQFMQKNANDSRPPKNKTAAKKSQSERTPAVGISYKVMPKLDESWLVEDEVEDDHGQKKRHIDHNLLETPFKPLGSVLQSTTFKPVNFLDTIIDNRLYYSKEDMNRAVGEYYRDKGQSSIGDAVKARLLKVVLNNEVDDHLLIPLMLSLTGQYPYISSNNLSYSQIDQLRLNSTSADYAKSMEYVKGLTPGSKLNSIQIAKDAYISAHIAAKTAEERFKIKSKKYTLKARDLLPVAAIVAFEYHRTSAGNPYYPKIFTSQMTTKEDKRSNISFSCKVISHVLFGMLELGYKDYFSPAIDDVAKQVTDLIDEVSHIDEDLAKTLRAMNKNRKLSDKYSNIFKCFIFGQVENFSPLGGVSQMWMENCRQMIVLYLLMPQSGLIYLLSRMIVACRDNLISYSKANTIVSYFENVFVGEALNRPISSLIDDGILKHIGVLYKQAENAFVHK